MDDTFFYTILVGLISLSTRLLKAFIDNRAVILAFARGLERAANFAGRDVKGPIISEMGDLNGAKQDIAAKAALHAEQEVGIEGTSVKKAGEKKRIGTRLKKGVAEIGRWLPLIGSLLP